MLRRFAKWTCFAAPPILASLAPVLAIAESSGRATETEVRITRASLERFAESAMAPSDGLSPNVVKRRMNDRSLYPFFDSLSRAHTSVAMTLRTCGSETMGLTARTGALSATTEIAVNLSSRLPVYAFRNPRTGQQIVLDYNTLMVNVYEGASFGRERRYELSFEQWVRRAASPGSDSSFRRLSSLGFVTMSAIQANLRLMAAAACPPFLGTIRERALEETNRTQGIEPVGVEI